MKRWVVTGTSMVVEAENEFEAVDRAQETSGWQWEAEEWRPEDEVHGDGDVRSGG